MNKPSSCQGCPLYQDGTGFVPDDIVDNAPVFVLMQNPGEEEVASARPAVGKTGKMMDAMFLPAAGLQRDDNVSVGNVIKCRWQHSNNLPKGKMLDEAVQHCTTAHLRVPDSAKLVVAQGALAAQASGNKLSITDWRGFILPEKLQGKPVLAVLHTADLFHDPKMKLPTLRDWTKVRAFLAGSWPQPDPTPYTTTDAVEFDDIFTGMLANHATKFLTIDTEYVPDTKHLLLLGIGTNSNSTVLQFDAAHAWSGDLRQVGESLRSAVGRIPVVFQNTFADYWALNKAFGIQYHNYAQIDDTMLAHAVLWSDWPHSLEFIASVYSPHRKLKHLSKTEPYLYNAGDVSDTTHAWFALQDEFAKDPASYNIYKRQSLGLVPILLRDAPKGIRVNKQRVESAIVEYEEKQRLADLYATGLTGYPLNLGSNKQLQWWLYNIQKYPLQKHKKTKKPSIDEDSIAALRQHLGPAFDADDEARFGLSVEHALARIDEGADPVLEFRVVYAAATQILSHYLNPARNVERIYPDFEIHAQASGRWSTKNPPLAQLPADLRDIIIPDEGERWFAWDWSQIELRILAALARDEVYLDAFERGYDTHTDNTCAIFGLPMPPNRLDPHRATDAASVRWRSDVGWQGKEDTRYVFTKRFVYRLHYGGEPRLAGDIPGAKQLNLDGKRLVEASRNYLRLHPRIADYWRRVREEGLSTGECRTFMGRRRRLFVTGPAAVRIIYNHPMQGAVSDIFNTVVCDIRREIPQARFVYGMHDAQTWGMPSAQYDRALDVARQLVDREWDIHGVRVRLPATFKGG